METNQISVKKIKELHYVLDKNKKIIKFKPWLGDLFSGLYDKIMEKSVFPKKFDASILEHYTILQKELSHIKNQNVLEIATGSGDAVIFLYPNNNYTGCDISRGLLRIAYNKFKEANFEQINLYIADACALPFNDNQFDAAICNLSLNFFSNIELFISELKRVLRQDTAFYCCIAIKDRIRKSVKIQGNIFYEKELKNIFEKAGFDFTNLGYYNGALLYFKAQKN